MLYRKLRLPSQSTCLYSVEIYIMGSKASKLGKVYTKYLDLAVITPQGKRCRYPLRNVIPKIRKTFWVGHKKVPNPVRPGSSLYQRYPTIGTKRPTHWSFLDHVRFFVRQSPKTCLVQKQWRKNPFHLATTLRSTSL